MSYPKELQQLIALLKKLPGVGNRTASRYAFHLISWKEEELNLLSQACSELKKNLQFCTECGCLKGLAPCRFCDEKRNRELLCVVASVRDVYQIEETNAFNGLYHVIRLLSPMEGFGPESLRLDHLKNRIQRQGVKEVILALDPTLEGDATSLYLKRALAPIAVSRLAFGLPVGSSIEYSDGGTLVRALLGRQKLT